jgi:multicomponent Na+:H+ antiporter subunit B
MKPKRIIVIFQYSVTIIAAAALLLPLILASAPWPAAARDHLQERAVAETGAINTVSAIYLGYRVFDTLGETIVLLVAVSGTIGIIAHAGGTLARGYEDRSPVAGADPGAEGSPAPPRRLRTVLLEVVTGKLGPIVLIFGLYVMLYGHLSPGGGFQGGVVIASGIVFLALGGRVGASTRLIEPRVLSTLETSGFLLLVLASLVGIPAGSGFFSNVMTLIGLPPVAFIIMLNAVIGIKVGAGIGFMCIAMLGRVSV